MSWHSTYDLLGKVERARALGTKKEKSEHSVVPAPPPLEVVRLPPWPQSVRAVPNGFLRSALFGAIKPGACGATVVNVSPSRVMVHVAVIEPSLAATSLKVVVL